MNTGVLFNTDRLSAQELCEYAASLEELGIESLWLPELFTRDPFATAGFLLSQTKTLKIGTGIANIYVRDATATISSASSLSELSDGRFVLGLGVSNAGLNQARGHQWEKPLGKLSRYLDDMKQVTLTRTGTMRAAQPPTIEELARLDAQTKTALDSGKTFINSFKCFCPLSVTVSGKRATELFVHVVFLTSRKIVLGS